MITYIDTDAVQSVANSVKTLAGELDSEINSLFRRLANVPTVTKEWVGGQANVFFSRVELDKRQYSEMIDSLKAIALELEKEASIASSSIKNNSNGE